MGDYRRLYQGVSARAAKTWSHDIKRGLISQQTFEVWQDRNGNFRTESSTHANFEMDIEEIDPDASICTRRFTSSIKFRPYSLFMVSILRAKVRATVILGDPGAVRGGEGKSERANKIDFFSPNIFFRPFRLSLAPTNCHWVSEDALRSAKIQMLDD